MDHVSEQYYFTSIISSMTVIFKVGSYSSSGRKEGSYQVVQSMWTQHKTILFSSIWDLRPGMLSLLGIPRCGCRPGSAPAELLASTAPARIKSYPRRRPPAAAAAPPPKSLPGRRRPRVGLLRVTSRLALPLWGNPSQFCVQARPRTSPGWIWRRPPASLCQSSYGGAGLSASSCSLDRVCLGLGAQGGFPSSPDLGASPVEVSLPVCLPRPCPRPPWTESGFSPAEKRVFCVGQSPKIVDMSS